MHKDSLLLQVKASGSKVDNLIDKMRDHREGKLPQKEMDCMQKCMTEINDEMRVKVHWIVVRAAEF